MAPEIIFHLVAICMIGACVLGCAIAAAVELTHEQRFARRLRRMHNKRRAAFRKRSSPLIRYL